METTHQLTVDEMPQPPYIPGVGWIELAEKAMPRNHIVEKYGMPYFDMWFPAGIIAICRPESVDRILQNAPKFGKWKHITDARLEDGVKVSVMYRLES